MPLPQEQLYTEADYWNLPEDVRAELIDGHLYYMSAPSRIHQEILISLAGQIRNYIRSRHGSCRVYPSPFAVRLRKDRENTVEPDISVICDRSKLTDRGCTGAPDWIVEIISQGNASHDYIRKLNLYADAGVREYWIVDPLKEKVHVYALEKEHFNFTSYTFRDKVTAGIFEDLTIDFAELIDDIPGNGY
ncbi:MAG: Uma2 family endonuclease [Lachnospiraceae bacterium]|nr:Uma2 family endonuclease [Lachnospiraceae bacterium]